MENDTANLGPVTKLAYDAITDDWNIAQEYETPEDALRFLLDDSNFKTLPQLIRETMLATGKCTDSATDEELIGILHSLIAKQDEENGFSRPNHKKTVRDWILGRCKTIRQPQDAIEICFALGLSLPLAKTFLNKLGHGPLNIRNSDDAIYMYCLINRKSLADANRLKVQFAEFCTQHADKKVIPEKTMHSGETTHILEMDLQNSSWENDEDFLSTFLFANKDKFIGYSTGAYAEYFRLKNRMMLRVFIDVFQDWVNEVQTLQGEAEQIQKLYRNNTVLALRSALKKCEKPSSILYEVSGLLDDDMMNAPKVIVFVQRIAEANPDIESQKEISVFLADIMKTEGFLKRVISCIQGDNGRIRKYRDSDLYTGGNNFGLPNEKAFSAFEKKPFDTFTDTSTRNTLILMYYINYAYAYTEMLNRESSFAGSDLMGFEDFYNGLNDLLERCHLPAIYPANRFDWLILRSVRAYDIADETDLQVGNPVKFFNDVLSFSFGEDPDAELKNF